MPYEAPAKYQGTGTYGVLTEAEQAHWNEYTNLRGISDWPGFDEKQDKRRADSKNWLNEQMDEIVSSAKQSGWDTNNRGKRYDFLSTQNSGSPKHEVRLPCPGTATDSERVYIEEREVYLVFYSTTDAQTSRKQANLTTLVDKRKQLWHLMQDDASKNKSMDRQNRYDALCIATSHGDAYTEWDKTHNKYGEPYSPDEPDPEKSKRSQIKDWLDSYLGVHENPDGSNRGSPQPSKWQERVYGDDGVPWCACFAVCSAWDVGISGSGTAGVYNNVQLAKQGKGIYKGWTNDPSKVHAGDHAFIGSDHTGVIYDAETGQTVEGNTSNSGSQWNGGSVVKKTRGWGYWSAGFGIVRAD
jgi:hypothetical protein